MKYLILAIPLLLSACAPAEGEEYVYVDNQKFLPQETHIVATRATVAIKEENFETDDDQALYLDLREEEQFLLYTVDLNTCTPHFAPAKGKYLEVEIPNSRIKQCLQDFWDRVEVGSLVTIAGNLTYSSSTNSIEMNYIKWVQLLDSKTGEVLLDSKECEWLLPN